MRKVILTLIIMVGALVCVAPDTSAQGGGTGNTEAEQGCNAINSVGCVICSAVPFNNRCARWRLTTPAGFQEAWNNRVGKNYTDPNVCFDASNEWVVYAGTNRSDIGFNHVLYNFGYANAGMTNYKLDRRASTDGFSVTSEPYWNNMQLVIQELNTNEANLAFFCPGMLGTDLRPWSKINGQESTVYAAPGTNVKFTHGVNKGNSHAVGSGDYSILQPNSATSLASSIPSTSPNAGSAYGFNDGGGSNYIGLHGNYSSITFKVPDVPNGTQWCQQIQVRADRNTGPSGTGYTTSNRVCIIVRRTEPQPSDDVCKEIIDGYTFSQLKGYTIGRSIVANNTKDSSTWLSKTRDSRDSKTTVGSVWAKPSDKIQFRHTLCPGAQAVRTGALLDVVAAANNICTITADPTTHIFGTTITSNNFSCALARGTTTTRDMRDPSSSSNGAVKISDAGKTIRQSLTYSSLSVEVNNDPNYSIRSADNGSATTTAEVKVPYNYTTDPHVATPDVPVVFPGEPIRVETTVDVDCRNNTTVDDDDCYATVSKPSTYEVISFITTPTSNKPTGYGDTTSTTGTTNYPTTPGAGASCNYYTSPTTLSRACQVIKRETGKSLNPDGALNGVDNQTLFGDSVTIDDYPVGTKFCVAVSVWPADSHNGAITDASNNGTALNANSGGYWQHTAPTCFDIAKKPNLQVWGSSIFSTGSIVASQTNKKQSDGSYRLFGSWSEYATIATSPIYGFGSGAAFGYELNNGGTFAKSGGLPNSGSTNECNYSKSTVTNSDCNSLGDANISSSGVAVTTARLIARYATTTGASTPGNSFSLSGLDGKYYSTQNLTINASTIPKGKTIVIYTTGNITVAGNIAYTDGVYTNISDLPQVLLIAQNIYVNPNVTNIDAWLVAGRQGGSGIIDTCAGHNIGSLDANTCNQKLTINGPVFANKLITKRTAGAGSGTSSIDPAEVFNLRSDAYLWAMQQAQNYRQAVVTNLKNLAPRY